MRIGQIWRYPVKSMAGERLRSAVVGLDGIAGDRVVQVQGPDGRIMTARRFHRLLGHRAVLGPDGEPLIDGRPWADPAVAADVSRVAPGGRLIRGEHRFDILPLLVATDGAIAAFGRDGRRLRPNLVIDGVPDLAERDWPGRQLVCGDLVIELVDLRERCVITTYDPDTLEQDPRVLRDIVERFDGTLALNCSVARAGEIAEGARVTII